MLFTQYKIKLSKCCFLQYLTTGIVCMKYTMRNLGVKKNVLKLQTILDLDKHGA